jgi:glutamate/tyrosine decarboxylase-like PLP-dependent enzyme
MNITTLSQDFSRIESEIANGPIYPTVTADQIRDHLNSRFRFQQPIPLADLVAECEAMLRHWQVHVTHPRYFGLFNPSVTFASALADTLVAFYNPQLANWRTAPAANEIERHTLAFLAHKFGLPADHIANYTSGGMEANLSSVIVALTWAFPDYGEFGLRALPAQPILYVSPEAHNGYHKLSHMTGLGRRALHPAPTAADLKISPTALRQQIHRDRAAGLAPFLVVATAGSTATGIIDPLPELAQLCREENLWLHVDAAWGGAAILSPSLAPVLRGIELADSITCDAHKWLSVPMGAGIFFCRHRTKVEEAFRAALSYMPTQKDAPVLDPFSTTPQWSRRFIGLKLFMALAERGESGYCEMIEHQTAIGDYLREQLTATGWTIANSTPLPLLCFTRANLDHDALLAALKDQQICWMTLAKVNGAPCIRACITSFLTQRSHIDYVVAEINRIAATLPTIQTSATPTTEQVTL